MNINSNNAGTGGGSRTGCAAAGKGTTGGNASSGNSGTAKGGSVSGSGGMMNVDSSEYSSAGSLQKVNNHYPTDNAGTAGESTSGCAAAGDSKDGAASS